uniref:DUF834 domain-containing protein n=1 Tax=Oryza meridionalis TaxID=40149 RepID=A0A0E0FBQ3_9ORYZ
MAMRSMEGCRQRWGRRTEGWRSDLDSVTGELADEEIFVSRRRLANGDASVRVGSRGAVMTAMVTGVGAADWTTEIAIGVRAAWRRRSSEDGKIQRGEGKWEVREGSAGRDRVTRTAGSWRR